MTTRSPSSRKRGSSEKFECTSEPSDLVATSIRTASRVMPRFSGGAGASSSGGSEKESGWSSGRRAPVVVEGGVGQGAHASAPRPALVTPQTSAAR